MPAIYKFDLQILLVAITDYSVKEKSYESFDKIQAEKDLTSVPLPLGLYMTSKYEITICIGVYAKECAMKLSVLRDPFNFLSIISHSSLS